MARRWNVLVLFISAFTVGRGRGGDLMVVVTLLLLAITLTEPAWWFSVPARESRTEARR
jgi:hypothetical protein